jgi:hypothetical protein
MMSSLIVNRVVSSQGYSQEFGYEGGVEDHILLNDAFQALVNHLVPFKENAVSVGEIEYPQ